jgi:hypothetical protein
MKLSTAIRRGSQQDAHHRHGSSTLPPSLDFTASVLGTAWLGLGRPTSRLPDGLAILAELSEVVEDDLIGTIVAHPVTGLPMSLSGAVLDLDVAYGWTVEEITAWLADLGY